MKTSQVSFGTKPRIGIERATCALPKYGENLTEGILDAFKKLEKNGIDDKFWLIIGPTTKRKKITTDVIELQYNYQSSLSASPKTLEKLDKSQISDFILKTYEKLKGSHKNSDFSPGYGVGAPQPSIAHQRKINKLLKLFGQNDWTGM